MSKFSVEEVAVDQVSDYLDDASSTKVVDLGAVSFVVAKHSVIGDFIVVSTAEGRCAIIK